MSISQLTRLFIHKKNSLALGSLVLMVCSITACKTPLKIGYLRYDAPTLLNRLDKDSALGFVFQFYTQDASDMKQPLQAVSFAALKGRVFAVPPDTLHLTNRAYKTFKKQECDLGNSTISREGIEKVIRDETTGNRIVFDYILFQPTIKNGHIIYRLKAESSNKKALTQEVDTEPCPPAACAY